MKQQHLVLVLFALLIASFTTSFHSYKTTERWITEDMQQALTLTLTEQRSDVISQDTIRIFNSHLQMAELKGKATITIDTQQKQELTCKAQCSMATIFSLSDQRPAMILWSATLLWVILSIYWQRKRQGTQRQLQFINGQFRTANGEFLSLTPMQQQLMELFWQAPDHTLTKDEICATLWAKKPNANDTLYTLIHRLRPIIETNTTMKIETDRGRSYSLKDK